MRNILKENNIAFYSIKTFSKPASDDNFIRSEKTRSVKRCT